ncbi:hypothetical protein ACJMK2_040689, partial [Sinanodonta woodiana]
MGTPIQKGIRKAKFGKEITNIKGIRNGKIGIRKEIRKGTQRKRELEEEAEERR